MAASLPISGQEKNYDRNWSKHLQHSNCSERELTKALGVAEAFGFTEIMDAAGAVLIAERLSTGSSWKALTPDVDGPAAALDPFSIGWTRFVVLVALFTDDRAEPPGTAGRGISPLALAAAAAAALSALCLGSGCSKMSSSSFSSSSSIVVSGSLPFKFPAVLAIE